MTCDDSAIIRAGTAGRTRRDGARCPVHSGKGCWHWPRSGAPAQGSPAASRWATPPACQASRRIWYDKTAPAVRTALSPRSVLAVIFGVMHSEQTSRELIILRTPYEKPWTTFSPRVISCPQMIFFVIRRTNIRSKQALSL
eukprot:scaffold91683_cov40-Prasinocladus_malaysianus.AAC.2